MIIMLLLKPNLTFLFLQFLEAAQLSVLLQEVRDLSASPKWSARHGSVLCIASLLKHNPSTIMTSSLFSSMLNSLKSSLKDEKVHLRNKDSPVFCVTFPRFLCNLSDTFFWNSFHYVKPRQRPWEGSCYINLQRILPTQEWLSISFHQ